MRKSTEEDENIFQDCCADSGEGRSMNESIDLVEADVSEGSSVSDNGSEN